ncbi:putative cytochrome p450 protein [Botrytis fragariae]|uniref:Putative cytochrome p450 protein n=1 Tax=Botrytis fragariae TaxID=1964551 RepID=A0A8H6B5B1_9HELO|nr:putative cytochrome p450 protein [Botrytis fragariae]KAF5879686.1 putative cytochrome p450 protein [Botrytis fragariae]
MGNLLLFVVPLALAIAAVQFIQKYDLSQLPPGPPGRDHANLLDNDRWNMFKSWNEQYGPAFFLFLT